MNGLEPADPAEREVATALRRAGAYRLLGAAFARPTREGLRDLAALAAAAAETATDAPGLARALAAFAAAAAGADPEVTADEYGLLFDRQAPCAPYEGAYGEAPQMAGKAAQMADIAGFYAAFGLAPAPARPDLEDHVAAELEFMSALAVKEAYALAEGDAEAIEVTRGAEAAFLRDHLGRWAVAFAEDLLEATPLPYYTTAGSLLAAWVELETGSFGIVRGRPPSRAGRNPLEEAAFSCPMAPPGSRALAGP
jgi:TorA maturation chaperone TorD